MNRPEFVEFLKTASDQGATAADVCEVIKQATGEQIDPAQIEALLAQLGQHEQVAPHGEHQEQLDPSQGQHPQHGHMHGHPGMEGHPGMGGDPSQGAGGEPQISEEELAQLAELISQHMQSGDMGTQEHGLPEQSAQGMDMAKQSDYIEGFLKKAHYEYGFDLDTAINIYANQYANTLNMLKDAATREDDNEKIASYFDEETLSYFQGMGEKAAAMNFTYDDTLALLKEGGATDLVIRKLEELSSATK